MIVSLIIGRGGSTGLQEKILCNCCTINDISNISSKK